MVTLSTRAHLWCLCWARCVLESCQHTLPLRLRVSMIYVSLFLYVHVILPPMPSGQVFPTTTLFLLSSFPWMSPSLQSFHHLWFNHPNIISRSARVKIHLLKNWTRPAVISSLLDPNISKYSSQQPLLNTLSLGSSLVVRDRVMESYYTLIFLTGLWSSCIGASRKDDMHQISV